MINNIYISFPTSSFLLGSASTLRIRKQAAMPISLFSTNESLQSSNYYKKKSQKIKQSYQAAHLCSISVLLHMLIQVYFILKKNLEHLVLTTSNEQYFICVKTFIYKLKRLVPLKMNSQDKRTKKLVCVSIIQTFFYILSLKKKKKRKILGNKTSGVPASFFMCVLNLIMNT